MSVQWTEIATRKFKDTLAYTELNAYLRDNMNALRGNARDGATGYVDGAITSRHLKPTIDIVKGSATIPSYGQGYKIAVIKADYQVFSTTVTCPYGENDRVINSSITAIFNGEVTTNAVSSRTYISLYINGLKEPEIPIVCAPLAGTSTVGVHYAWKKYLPPGIHNFAIYASNSNDSTATVSGTLLTIVNYGQILYHIC